MFSGIKKISNGLVLILPFVLALVLSIKAMREPDLWWQIRTGEWILDNGEVPKTDVFSMTYFGTKWINIKWGFEVLAALTARIFSPELVYLWQGVISVISLLLMRNMCYHFFKKNEVVFLLCSILFLLCTEYRMIARPEMFSHLGVVVYLYIWWLAKSRHLRYTLLFIPAQLVWANMHEAFGTGVAMLLIFIAGEWWLYFKNKEKRPTFFSVVGMVAILSVCINPNGVELLLRPLNIFSQLQENKFTTELVAFYMKEYWQKEAYYMALMIAVLFLFYKKNKSTVTDFFKKNKSYIAYPAIVAAFGLLSLLAYRNIVFLFIVLFPVTYFLLLQSIQNTEKWKTGIVLLGVMFYVGIVTNSYYSLVGSRDKYGLAVLGDKNPTGAAAYIRAHGLQQKKGFSDYLSSSYLLWRLQPDYKTYIDLRDLDIFPAAFFEHYGVITEKTDSFFLIDKTYQFDYVVLYRPIHQQLHYKLYNDSIYACVYADKTAVVYQKTDSFSRGDIFSIAPNLPVSNVSFVINKIFNPLYKEAVISESENHFHAAEFYATVGKVKIARERIDAYCSQYPEDEQGLVLRQKIYSFIQQYNLQ